MFDRFIKWLNRNNVNYREHLDEKMLCTVCGDPQELTIASVLKDGRYIFIEGQGFYRWVDTRDIKFIEWL